MDVEGGGKGQDGPSIDALVPQYGRTPGRVVNYTPFSRESDPANGDVKSGRGLTSTRLMRRDRPILPYLGRF